MKRFGIFMLLIALTLPILLWSCGSFGEDPSTLDESGTPFGVTDAFPEAEKAPIAGTDLGLGIFIDSIDPKNGADPSCIVLRVTATDQYKNKTEYSFDVTVNENGGFTFYIPSRCFYVEVMLESLAEGYGISYCGALVEDADKRLGFFYAPIDNVILKMQGEGEVYVTFQDKNKNAVYAEYSYTVELDNVYMTVPELDATDSLDAKVLLNALGETKEYSEKYEFGKDAAVVSKIHSLHEKGVITDEQWINYICDVYLLYPELHDQMFLSDLFETVFYYYRDTEDIPDELRARIEENFDFSGLPMDGEVIID